MPWVANPSSDAEGNEAEVLQAHLQLPDSKSPLSHIALVGVMIATTTVV